MYRIRAIQKKIAEILLVSTIVSSPLFFTLQTHSSFRFTNYFRGYVEYLVCVMSKEQLMLHSNLKRSKWSITPTLVNNSNVYVHRLNVLFSLFSSTDKRQVQSKEPEINKDTPKILTFQNVFRIRKEAIFLILFLLLSVGIYIVGSLIPKVKEIATILRLLNKFYSMFYLQNIK